MEKLHFKSQKERLDYLKGNYEEIKPKKAEEIVPKVADEPIEKPKKAKKSAKKSKKEAKDGEIQAE